MSLFCEGDGVYFMSEFLCAISVCMHVHVLQVLSDCVSEPEVGQSENLSLLEQLLHCVTAITSAAARTCHMRSSALFSVLLRIAASRHALTLGSQVVHPLSVLICNDIIHNCVLSLCKSFKYMYMYI